MVHLYGECYISGKSLANLMNCETALKILHQKTNMPVRYNKLVHIRLKSKGKNAKVFV